MTVQPSDPVANPAGDAIAERATPKPRTRAWERANALALDLEAEGIDPALIAVVFLQQGTMRAVLQIGHEGAAAALGYMLHQVRAGEYDASTAALLATFKTNWH
jgi:hypothetical protein